MQFSMVIIPALNQVVRPFTAKWHRRDSSGEFEDEDARREFRRDLRCLLADMRNCNRMLTEIVGVEDLTDLEQVGSGQPDNDSPPPKPQHCITSHRVAGVK